MKYHVPRLVGLTVVWTVILCSCTKEKTIYVETDPYLVATINGNTQEFPTDLYAIRSTVEGITIGIWGKGNGAYLNFGLTTADSNINNKVFEYGSESHADASFFRNDLGNSSTAYIPVTNGPDSHTGFVHIKVESYKDNYIQGTLEAKLYRDGGSLRDTVRITNARFRAFIVP